MIVGAGLVAVALVDLAVTALPVAARGGPVTALLAKSLLVRGYCFEAGRM